LKRILAVPFSKQDMSDLTAEVEVYWLGDLNERDLDRLLPSVDGLFVNLWPKELDAQRLDAMSNLRFVQSGFAGVNHIPFQALPKGVVVSSNAGGFSDEVGEFAWALLLAAAKRVTEFNSKWKENADKTPLELGRRVMVLKGKTLGVLGYGGIGGSVATYGRAFGMKVRAFSRKDIPGVESLTGEAGLTSILKESDAVVIALPLTNITKNLIGEKELSLMKPGAVLVNVARAEIVEERAVYEHLQRNKTFVYATDVWWTKEGKETYPPEMPFFDLENFIGTPHVSGPSAVPGRGPQNNAVENLLRFARGEAVRNVVVASDYL
jgi:phosphoglycerate dehydrogenase-like enzyme